MQSGLIGYDIPARAGMAEQDIQTPCLIIDLDAFERNLKRMSDFCAEAGLKLRPHGKMHKSVDVAKQQIAAGAKGVCCQKVSEGLAFARGGIDDILISNEVRDPHKIALLTEIAKLARCAVCCDDVENIAELSAAACAAEVEIGIFAEIDCGQRRCGVSDPADALAIAHAAEAAPGLRWEGVQAYQGAMQHLKTHEEREKAAATAISALKAVLKALNAAGLSPATITGGGTGSFRHEAASGLWTELQCGSYAFMDADYGQVLDETGQRLDQGEWENALFVLTSVMSRPRAGVAICDAGLKSLTMECGLPVIAGRDDVRYVQASDEHGEIQDEAGALTINQRLRLIPGHCDPTCNLHDWYVCVRNEKAVELWPVTARGRSY